MKNICKEIDLKQANKEIVDLTPIYEYIQNAQNLYIISPKDKTSEIFIEFDTLDGGRFYVSLFAQKEIAELYLKKQNITNCEIIEIKEFRDIIKKYWVHYIIFNYDFSVIKIDYNEFLKEKPINGALFLTYASYLFTNKLTKEEYDKIALLTKKIFSKVIVYVNETLFFKGNNNEKILIVFTNEFEYEFLNKQYEFNKMSIPNLIKMLKNTDYDGFIVNINSTKFSISKNAYDEILNYALTDKDTKVMIENILNFDVNELNKYSTEFCLQVWNYALDNEKFKNKVNDISTILKRNFIRRNQFFFVFDLKEYKFYTYTNKNKDIVLPIFTNIEIAEKFINNEKQNNLKVFSLPLTDTYNVVANLKNNCTSKISINGYYNGLQVNINHFLYNMSKYIAEINPAYFYCLPLEISMENLLTCNENNISVKHFKDMFISKIFNGLIYMLKNKNDYYMKKDTPVFFNEKRVFLDKLEKQNYEIIEYTPFEFICFIKESNFNNFTFENDRVVSTFSKDYLITRYLRNLLLNKDKKISLFDANDYLNLLHNLSETNFKEQITNLFFKNLKNLYILYDDVKNEIVIDKDKNSFIHIYLSEVPLKNNYTLKEFSIKEFLELIEHISINLVKIHSNEDNIYRFNINTFINNIKKSNINITCFSCQNDFIFNELGIPSGQKYECVCPKCKTLLFRKAI